MLQKPIMIFTIRNGSDNQSPEDSTVDQRVKKSESIQSKSDQKCRKNQQ